MHYRDYRSEITGTTGPRRFCADINYQCYKSLTGTTGRSETSTTDGWRKEAQFGVIMNYQSETGTTGPRPVLPVRDRYYRWMAEGGAEYELSVLPV
jgi:hypothetical protein